MKSFWLLNMVSIVFIIAGTLLAINGVHGWGWLIFCAVICCEAPKDNSDKDDK